MSEIIPVRLAVQQRVLPAYRAAFFDLLAQSCANGMSVFYGDPRPDEALGAQGELKVAERGYAENLYLGSGRLYACFQRGMINWLEAWQPDVLIVEANPRYLSTPRAVLWMKAHGRPVIGWGLGAPPAGSFWRRILRERFLRQFDALITYSKAGFEQYQRAGFRGDRIFIAPNAVAPRPAGSCPERPDSFRGRPMVLYVGRLQPRKRVDMLIRACARLPESIRPRLVVVGDGPERAALEALAKEVYPETEFPGEKRGGDLAPIWAEADLFVLPGTGGLAVQEAMAAGLPVIVAEADGTQVDLVREENGWRLRPGDEEHLVVTLQEALADPARLRRMGRASYRIVDQEINLEAMVNGFFQAMKSVWLGNDSENPRA
ncbi:glycosyltransferase [Anaerolinea thermolimosa]|uniref:glycosyltransferase family 4 protein n=1 Tax=Anaerolinea thermolimosa TaxID=229919 RepID=UPI000785C1BD|nr:glycosyltransferase family 4 protein [Anaerolinea thermolimosa]GAP06100.1 glycosyltransferase [Anaerolinea thermolimosa]